MYADTDMFHVSWLKDDINLFDYNVQERVEAFVAAAYFQVWFNFQGSQTLIYRGLFIDACSYIVFCTVSFSFLFILVIVIRNY